MVKFYEEFPFLYATVDYQNFSTVFMCTMLITEKFSLVLCTLSIDIIAIKLLL